MRVMTYNVKNGGQDDFDFSRLDSILEVVTTVKPHVLALQELKHFQNSGRSLFHRVENETGLRGFFGEAVKTGQHVAVFVPRNVDVLESHVDNYNYHHASVKVTFKAKTEVVTVVGTHLCPHGGANRIGEAQRLANAAKPDQPVILMGDLNSLDPWEDHSAQVRELPRHYQARHLMPGSAVEVDTRTIATLESAGFIDLWRESNDGDGGYTAPTSGGGGYEFSSMRVDYIFGTPQVSDIVRQCYVVREPKAVEFASDHYPVCGDVDIEV